MTRPDAKADRADALVENVRLRGRRRGQWLREGELSIGSRLARIGVLGWIIVTPTIIGLFVGRRLDERSGGGLVFTGALLMLGLALGCWSAWKWVRGA